MAFLDHLKKLWWMQGIIGTISIIAVMDNVFKWETYEFLAFTHALIIHWNDWISIPFYFIAALFERWQIQVYWDEVERNILIYIGVIFLPGCKALFNSLYESSAKNAPELKLPNRLYYDVVWILLFPAMFILTGFVDRNDLEVIEFIFIFGTSLFLPYILFRLDRKRFNVIFLVCSVLITLELAYRIPAVKSIAMDWVESQQASSLH